MKYRRTSWETEFFLNSYETLKVLEKLKSDRHSRLLDQELEIINQTKEYIEEISTGMTNLSDSRRLFLARRTLEILDLQGIKWAEAALSSIHNMLRSSSLSQLNTDPSLKEDTAVSNARKVLASYYKTLDKIIKGDKVSDEELEELMKFLYILTSDRQEHFLSKYAESQESPHGDVW